ncbi:hypothetical protein MTO96_011268 [Rhipicephalus appendiculatus]
MQLWAVMQIQDIARAHELTRSRRNGGRAVEPGTRDSKGAFSHSASVYFLRAPANPWHWAYIWRPTWGRLVVLGEGHRGPLASPHHCAFSSSFHHRLPFPGRRLVARRLHTWRHANLGDVPLAGPTLTGLLLPTSERLGLAPGSSTAVCCSRSAHWDRSSAVRGLRHLPPRGRVRTVATWLDSADRPVAWTSRLPPASPLLGDAPLDAPFRGLSDRHPTEPPQSYTAEEIRILCPICRVPEISRREHQDGPPSPQPSPCGRNSERHPTTTACSKNSRGRRRSSSLGPS